MRLLLQVCALAAVAGSLHAEINFRFDENTNRWTLSNARIEAIFHLTPEGRFQFVRLRSLGSSQVWNVDPAVPSSPIRLRIGDRRVGDRWIDESSSFRLLSQSSAAVPREGRRQTIHLEDSSGLGHVTIELELYEQLPVLRYGVRYHNTSGVSVTVTAADFLPWRFNSNLQPYRALRVEQWLPVADPADFEPLVGTVSGDDPPFVVESGAHGRHCAWFALNGRQRGLAAGWEFDGRAEVRISSQSEDGFLQLEGQVKALNHPVAPGDSFQVPRAFLIPFSGTWDDASFLTHRFTESVLAKPLPWGSTYPVSWDSWAYGQHVDEATLRGNAEQAVRLGVELFVVDLGWARSIGDWRHDPVKFPSGLKALSNYVHSLGMKFGAHFAFAEAAPGSPVLEQNPDWTSSESYGYYGARSLCLAHKPVRDWIVSEAVRMIDDYGIDWILQDGENMVKECRRSTHTHHAEDSNYANAEALDSILKEIQRRRPNVAWENCENGGNLMTFNMVQNYVTSIVNDASGALGSRRAVYGATYPFPPRYTDRYMPEDRMNSYVTRSYMFGGPWIFMNKLIEMTANDLDFATAEILRYKQMRASVRDGKVLHLTAAPAPGRFDAIASYSLENDSAIAVVTRDQARSDSFRLRIREFDPGKSYRVTFADDARVLTYTGAQLRDDGIDVRLPQLQSAEIVYIEPLR